MPLFLLPQCNVTANEMIYATINNSKILGIIILLAERTFSPIWMTTTLKCSISLMKETMIFMILTNDKMRELFTARKMMNLYVWWKWFSQNLFCYQNMLKNISISVCTWMIWALYFQIPTSVIYAALIVGMIFSCWMFEQFQEMSPYESSWFSFGISFVFIAPFRNSSHLSTSTFTESIFNHIASLKKQWADFTVGASNAFMAILPLLSALLCLDVKKAFTRTVTNYKTPNMFLSISWEVLE